MHVGHARGVPFATHLEPSKCFAALVLIQSSTEITGKWLMLRGGYLLLIPAFKMYTVCHHFSLWWTCVSGCFCFTVVWCLLWTLFPAHVLQSFAFHLKGRNQTKILSKPVPPKKRPRQEKQIYEVGWRGMCSDPETSALLNVMLQMFNHMYIFHIFHIKSSAKAGEMGVGE